MERLLISILLLLLLLIAFLIAHGRCIMQAIGAQRKPCHGSIRMREDYLKVTMITMFWILVTCCNNNITDKYDSDPPALQGRCRAYTPASTLIIWFCCNAIIPRPGLNVSCCCWFTSLGDVPKIQCIHTIQGWQPQPKWIDSKSEKDPAS